MRPRRHDGIVIEKLGSQVYSSHLKRLVSRAQGHCIYCGRLARKLELDHVIPIARGGTGAKKNFIPCCRRCNSSKHDKDLADWLHEKHGTVGLARALVFIEQRKFLPELATDLFSLAEAR